MKIEAIDMRELSFCENHLNRGSAINSTEKELLVYQMYKPFRAKTISINALEKINFEYFFSNQLEKTERSFT